MVNSRQRLARRSLDTRPYRWTLYLVVVASVGVILWNAFDQYFVNDSWTYWTTRQDFLAEGGLRGFLKALFVPHNGHIAALIYAVFLPLDWLFGMHSYVPYLVPVILLHVAAGLMLFELLVRRVRPGVAVGAASVYLLMGNAGIAVSTAHYILWMIAVPATWFGLLVLDRHEGVNDRRLFVEVLGAALLASTLGFVVVFVVGFALVVRRRYALAASIPLAFGALWLMLRVALGLFSTLSGTGRGTASLGFEVSRLSEYVSFVWRGLTAATADLLAISWLPTAMVVLVAVAGAALWCVRGSRDDVVAATAVGAVFFYALVGIRGVAVGRPAYAPDVARYMLIAGTLLLPSLAWLADRLIDWRRWAAVPLAVLLSWSLLTNTSRQLELAEERAELGAANRVTIETAASLSGHLDTLESGFLVADRTARFTVGQFERLVAQGKVPCAADYDRAVGFAREQGMPEPTPAQVTCDR